MDSQPSRAGRSFKRPYSLSDPGVERGLTAYLESTRLELSNDVKFVETLVKTTENTLQYSKPPHKFTTCPTSSGSNSTIMVISN